MPGSGARVVGDGVVGDGVVKDGVNKDGVIGPWVPGSGAKVGVPGVPVFLREGLKA